MYTCALGLVNTFQSFHFPIKPYTLCADKPVRTLSGLPLTHCLQAAVQLAPPRRGDCVAVAIAQRTVSRNFLFPSACFFVA